MRKWLILVAGALLAAPGLAQSGDDEAFAAEIERQEQLDETVLVVDRLVESMLGMPVGRFADALPPEALGGSPVNPGDTLRDLGERNDPAFEQNVRGGARALTAMIGSMAQEFTAMLPALEAWGEGVVRAPDE